MRTYLPLLVAAALLVGCSKPPETTSQIEKIGPAPDVFRVKFETSKGEFVVQVNKEWSPHGADRFYELVKSNFYNEARFFRAVRGFMVQFGINGDPKISALWGTSSILDDAVKQSNLTGRITFAT